MNDKISPEDRAFLENMLHASDEFNYGDEIPEGLLLELNKKLDERISTYLLSHLSQEKIAEYRALNEKGASSEILDVYFSKNVPDYKEVMKAAYQDFYDSYLEQASESRLS